MTTAADVMSRPVVLVTPDLPARAALLLLMDYGFAALPVVVDDHVVGMVSESDLLQAAMDGSGGGTAVADVMSMPAVTMPVTATVAELAATMLAGCLRSVPVVDDDDRLVGMVGRIDLLGLLVQDEEMLAEHVRTLLHDYAGRRPCWDVELIDGVIQVTGTFADEAERRLIGALARTVSGVGGVELRPVAAASAD